MGGGALCAKPTLDLAGPSGIGFLVFTMSKVPELVDTVLLIVQRKNVMFLHWYHHITVLLYTWKAYSDGSVIGSWMACMNYTVHAVMYTYYCLNYVGLRSYLRILRPFITGLQLAQMVAGILIVAGAHYFNGQPGGCPHVTDSSIFYGGLMYFSYFLLFLEFFWKNYVSKPTKKSDAPSSPESNEAADAKPSTKILEEE